MISLPGFGEFQLDRERYKLLRGAQRVDLERMPMELLILLLENHGRVVNRDEIVERLWGKGAFVNAIDGINTAVKKIRNALRDDALQPRFIQTIKGQGYRFLAPVERSARCSFARSSSACEAGDMMIASIDSADPRLHAENIQHSLHELIGDVRQDMSKVEEPEFKTLLETTAEVLAGLQTAFKRYNERAGTSFVPHERRWGST
jgi:DNA-binding winged helix-turn-helix (wHTH) protein